MKEMERQVMCVLLRSLMDKNLITQDIHDQAKEKVLGTLDGPEFFCYATGEFHDFLHTGPLTVAFIFDFGTCYHYIVVAIFVIAFRCPERIFFREVRGQAEIRV